MPSECTRMIQPQQLLSRGSGPTIPAPLHHQARCCRSNPAPPAASVLTARSGPSILIRRPQTEEVVAPVSRGSPNVSVSGSAQTLTALSPGDGAVSRMGDLNRMNLSSRVRRLRAIFSGASKSRSQWRLAMGSFPSMSIKEFAGGLYHQPQQQKRSR